MKRFRYRLEALLKMKEHIEKERQKQLAVSLKKVNEQASHLDNIKLARKDSFDTLRKRTKHSFSVAEMLVVSRYIHKLKRDTVMGEELLKVLKDDEEKRRQKLLEASRERKKYNKLKERQREKHYREIETALTKENDEISISNYRLKKKHTN